MGDGKDHLFTLTNFTFAGEVAGVKWSDVFPGVPPHARVSHSAMIDLLRAAGAGDADARDSILDFIDFAGHRAAFDPAGAFRALEWTGATPIDDPPSIPTASGYGLLIMALAILLLAAHRLGRG
ncbi:MAG TPA: hypothetical protein VMV46_02255 [Thermoanaerobaculia bacterium]|nr:hypothetical protein [Thermoanaerobaculia bacterium]